jgi:hypothetical protein
VLSQLAAQRHLPNVSNREDRVDQGSVGPLSRKDSDQHAHSGFSVGARRRPTEAWYQLSKQEQDDLWERVQDVDRRAGAIWRILCDLRWADESLYDWAVVEYPDFDSYRQKVAELEELNWYRYWSGRTILGTKMDVDLDAMNASATSATSR